MLEDTIYLLSYLENIPYIERHKYLFHKNRFNKKTKEFFQNLFSSTEKVLAYWENNHNDILDEVELTDTAEISDDFEHIPAILRKKIQSHCKATAYFTFRIPSYHRFHVYLSIGNEISVDEIYKCFQNIFIFCHLLQPFIKTMCATKEIYFYLYFIPDKKLFPTNSSRIERHHVNGGFTTSCTYKQSIHVFRKEEWLRCLIHECMHHFEMDFTHFDENENINKTFCVKKPIFVNESFCEFWGEVLNNVFIISQKDDKDKIKTLKHHLMYEGIFSITQCVKYLKIHGATYSDICKNPIKKEVTPGFSYYVLKSILMTNVIPFLNKACTFSNPLKGSGNTEYFDFFNSFLLSQKDSPVMTIGTRELESYLRPRNKETILYKTARMGLYES